MSDARRLVRSKQIDARDGGQLSAALVQMHVDAAERLEPPAEARPGPSRPFRDGADPPPVLREEVEDAVGLAEPERAQDDGLSPIRPRPHAASVEMSEVGTRHEA